MNPAIAIFVKTPGHSPVKTRLAERVGRRLAEEWHLRSAQCVAAAVHATGLPGYWAVAEDDALNAPEWAGLARLAQGEGSLGRRMARVHGELVRRHGAAVLLGADMPQLQPRQLVQAAAWLRAGARRQVLGPAHDGGFWLFGSNRKHPPGCWEAVRYSASDTAREFIRAIGGEAWELLEPHTDLDVPEDLPGVLAELRAVSAPSALQQALIPWLQACIDRAA